jgi:hypothetical protein
MQQQETDSPSACARLGLSPSVGYRLAMIGALGPIHRNGRQWILTVAGVDAYAAQHNPVLDGSNRVELSVDG